MGLKMTEEEHKELSEKLKKADKILKDIKLIERALKPGARLSIDLYVGSEKGSAMSSLTLTKDLREDIESAVRLSLNLKLISLQDEYKNL
jgi:hypothetical protein